MLRWSEEASELFTLADGEAVMSRPLLVHLLYAVVGVATAAALYWLFPLSTP
jgi:hypothetical protein